MREGQQLFFRTSLEIIRLLGEGAFGKVYLVRKNFLNGLLPRDYALKCFHSEIGPEVLKAEAEAMFQVRSAHCVTVHSVEEFEDAQGLLMEYVEGLTLEEVCRTYDLSIDESDCIFSQIREGLGDLFAQKLIHGDLSPRNIMIDRKGRVVLLDFGLSSVLKDRVVGSPVYFSKSRQEGNAPTFQDDLFALSLLRYDIENRLIGRNAPTWFWEERKSNVVEADLAQISEVKVPKSLEIKIEMMIHARSEPAHTMAFQNVSGRGLTFKLVNIFFLLLTLWTSVGSTRESRYGLLAFRTLKWVKISLEDGRVFNSHESEVQISPGTHRISWQTAKKTGVKVLEVREKERKVLRDSDFN